MASEEALLHFQSGGYHGKDFRRWRRSRRLGSRRRGGFRQRGGVTMFIPLAPFNMSGNTVKHVNEQNAQYKPNKNNAYAECRNSPGF
jgi:hypothetical protein